MLEDDLFDVPALVDFRPRLLCSFAGKPVAS